MTREEKINKFINKFLTDLHGLKHGKDREYFNNTNEASLIKAGADWADKHPINVWHKASEEPLKDKVFLVELGENKYGFKTFILVENNIGVNWSEWAKETYLLRWAYISDLLPKGCDE